MAVVGLASRTPDVAALLQYPYPGGARLEADAPQPPGRPGVHSPLTGGRGDRREPAIAGKPLTWREVPGLDPAAGSERERTDRVAQRAIALAHRTLEHESGHEGWARGHSAAEQSAGPWLGYAGDAGRVHNRRVAGLARSHLLQSVHR